MNFVALLGVELRKLRRSHIIWILLLPVIFLWIPSVFNADMNFQMQAEGISPENNFFIQGFLGFSWIMYPASLVVCTVLLNQTERSGRGMIRMLCLPVRPVKICLSKFVVLLLLAAVQMVFMLGAYFPAVWLASQMTGYELMISPCLILKETVLIFASSLPMAAFFWMLAVCIRTPVFSIGAGLASIVPSVLIMNTKAWYVYPMCYPFYMITTLQGEMAENFDTFTLEFIPWIPTAAVIFILCLAVACLCFGRGERRTIL